MRFNDVTTSMSDAHSKISYSESTINWFMRLLSRK